MRKIITKIICFSAAAVAAIGLFITSGCSGYYNSKPLDYTSKPDDKIIDNGGFAVEKGNYIYFINGKEVYTADNTFGSVVKGAIMRISTADFDARKYSNAETVVPQIVYSGNNDAGIFVYGDYVYYATPSTDKNSDGQILNSNLEFKSTKLDGTDAMKNYYLQYSDASVEYRYVEVDGTVYLLYVATGEDYFKTGSSYTNIHSVNTKTGENTLLAYNVQSDSVTFDKTDVTNPRVFYTMQVTDFKYNTTSKYNQVYTVTADAKRTYETGAADLTGYFKDVYKDDENGYDAAKDPKYVNCGTLVLDGIGETDDKVVFDGKPVFNHGDSAEGRSSTYAIIGYQDGVLLYSRAVTGMSTSMYSAKVDGEILASGWSPVLWHKNKDYILQDSSSASGYTYIFDDNHNLKSVIISDSNGFIKAGVEDGKIIIDPNNDNTYYITKNGGQPTLLFTDNDYIYYSLTGGNGYTVHRISYNGNADDYSANMLPVADVDNDYKSIQILDLDCSSDWYKPEMFRGQLLFPTQTENMTSYVYIMACDLRNADGKVMNNAEIKELNKQYEKISKAIEDIDNTDYENLQNALKYAFYTGDGEYIYELAKAYVDVMNYSEFYYWSEDSLKIYDAFVAAEKDGEWYFGAPVKVNGEEVAANRRDYYYTVLGRMNDADKEAYENNLKSTYLQSYPEKDVTWFEGLSTGEKVGFIIGVCAGGLILIAAAVIVTLIIIRKRKEKMPEYKKKRIKVDTTDDKNINVYEDENSENK